jgi:hypothetical protein
MLIERSTDKKSRASCVSQISRFFMFKHADVALFQQRTCASLRIAHWREEKKKRIKVNKFQFRVVRYQYCAERFEHYLNRVLDS